MVYFDYTCCNLVLCTCGASLGRLSIKRGAIFCSTSFVLRIDRVGSCREVDEEEIELPARKGAREKRVGRKRIKGQKRDGGRKKGKRETVNEEVSGREDRSALTALPRLSVAPTWRYQL